MNRVLAAVMLLVGSAAEAAPVTFTFTGDVINDPFGIFGSATFTGSYTFDSATPQVLSTPTQSGYAGSGGIFQMTVSFARAADPALDGIAFTADKLNITLTHEPGGAGDRYQVTGQSVSDPAFSIEIDLRDPSASTFAGTLLPTSAPPLANFDQLASFPFALFAGTVDNPMEAQGRLLTLALIPEPATFMLLLPGLAALALRFRRF